MLTITQSTLPETATPSVSGMGRCPQGHEVPASANVSPPETLAGSLGHLWCQHCEVMITVPHYDVRHTLICECRGELKQVPGCRDCGAARDHINDDCCPKHKAEWAARERADELTAVLVDIAMTPWGVSHG